MSAGPSSASRAADAVAQFPAWVQPQVEEVPRLDVAQRLQHRVLHARVLDLEVHEEALHPLPLQAQVAAGRTAAADDRQRALLGVEACLVLTDVDQRPDDDVGAVVGHQPRRHGLQRAREEQVQEQRFDEVVEVVAERDLGGADLGRDAVEDAAAQPRAERARRGVGLEDVLHHLADLGVLDPVFPPALGAGLGDDVVLVVLVARVHVDRDEREVDRRALPQVVERLHQRPAVLAAGQPHHDAVTVLDEVEVLDGLGGLLGNLGLERGAVGRHSDRV